MSEATLPKFISFRGHGEIDFSAPLLATEDLLYAFALPSDRASVQALVDSTLAAPSKGVVDYQVLGNYVLLLFQHCGHFTSPKKIGWCPDSTETSRCAETSGRTSPTDPGSRDKSQRSAGWR